MEQTDAKTGAEVTALSAVSIQNGTEAAYTNCVNGNVPASPDDTENQCKPPRFRSVSEEEALRWMETFPERKDKIVAAVRKGKDRDISA